MTSIDVKDNNDLLSYYIPINGVEIVNMNKDDEAHLLLKKLGVKIKIEIN